MIRQIYKDLYYDEEMKCYLFIIGKDKRLLIEQQSYLLTYIIEILLNNQIKQPEVFDLNAKDEM